MPKPPARDDSPLKPFIVNDGHMICDFDGNDVHAGERIMLTQAQAEYYQERDNITFDMGAIFDDDKPSTASAAESGDGDTTDPAGTTSMDSDEPPEAKPAAKSRRKL